MPDRATEKTVNPFDYPEAYRQSLGAFEGLRKLGFVSSDIYFTVGGQAEDGAWQVAIVLLSQGKRFNVETGFVKDDPDNIEATWTKLSTAVNERRVSQDHLGRVWRESMIYNDRIGFVTALIGKGFVLSRATRRLLN